MRETAATALEWLTGRGFPGDDAEQRVVAARTWWAGHEDNHSR